jgi:hypothetical protein
MNTYIWQDAHNITRRHHPGGSVLVVAPDLNRARAIARENLPESACNEYCESPCIDGHEPAGGLELTSDPNVILILSGEVKYTESIMVFPNAGCC